jgi:hypothetical protein
MTIYAFDVDDTLDLGDGPVPFDDDAGAARDAGWRFIREHDFAAGRR